MFIRLGRPTKYPSPSHQAMHLGEAEMRMWWTACICLPSQKYQPNEQGRGYGATYNHMRMLVRKLICPHRSSPPSVPDTNVALSSRVSCGTALKTKESFCAPDVLHWRSVFYIQEFAQRRHVLYLESFKSASEGELLCSLFSHNITHKQQTDVL